MTKILFLILCIFVAHLSLAQQKELDSLLNELNKHSQEDTVRLNLLNDISGIYANLDYARGLETSKQAITLAQKLDNKKKLATAYMAKGGCYSGLGNHDASMDMYNRALKLYENPADKEGIGNIYHMMGMEYNRSSDYYTALEYEQKALAIFTALRNEKAMAKAINSTGVDYLFLADYPKALGCYFQSLQIYERLNNKSGEATALTNIGLVYNRLQKFSAALQYQQKSLKLFQELDNKMGIANSLSNMAAVYDNLLNPKLALEYFKKGLVLYESIGDKGRIAGAFQNIGITYFNSSKYVQALENFNKSVEVYEQIGDKGNLALTLNSIGDLYFKVPDSVLRSLNVSPANRYAKALQYDQRCLNIAIETGDIAQEADAWESISNIYKAQEKLGLALNAYQKYTVLKDSLFNEEKTEEITRKGMQYDFDKKQTLIKAANDKKQALAAAEINKQKVIRNASIVTGCIVLLAAIASIIFYKRKKDAIEKRKEAEFNTQVADTEMKALRAQMNPHFIYNSLNSINDYIDKHDTAKATLYTTKFAKLMRMILENSEQKEIPIADDLKALELYMQLEALRMNNKFDYEIYVDEDIDQENTLIPPLILQPFVENSIWHGISKKQDNGKIWIHIQKEGDMINCIVEDNGIGRSESARAKIGQEGVHKKAFGMKITKARIDIINKLKKSKAGITFSDLDAGTKIEVKLPEALAF